MKKLYIPVSEFGGVPLKVFLMLLIVAFVGSPAKARGQHDRFEPDGTPFQARFIIVNEIEEGHNLHNAQDEDWFSFYSPVDDSGSDFSISFETSESDVDIEWEVYDTNGFTKLAGGLSGDSFFPPKNETLYFIRVRNPSLGDGSDALDYSLQVGGPSIPIITGVVRDAANNSRIRSATVTVVGFTSVQTFDRPEAGRYVIQLPPANFTLTVASTGYEDFEREVTVRPGTTALSMDIPMTSIPDLLEVGVGPGAVTVTVAPSQRLDLKLNITNTAGDVPLQEWFGLLSIITGVQSPLFLITGSGAVEYIPGMDLSSATFPFDHSSEVFTIGRLALGDLGYTSGDTIVVFYAYQNAAAQIILENSVTLVVE